MSVAPYYQKAWECQTGRVLTCTSLYANILVGMCIFQATKNEGATHVTAETV